MHTQRPGAMRWRHRAFCIVGALVVIGIVAMPGMYVWALDDEMTRATLKGLPGVTVGVGEIAAAVAEGGVTQQQVQIEVERQLRRAGIPVFASQDADLPLDVAFFTVAVSTLQHDIGLYAYAVDLAVYQTAALQRDPTPRSLVTWTLGTIGLVEAANLRAIFSTIRQNVDQFIEAYEAVNPRARARSGSGTATIAARAHMRQVQERLRAAGFSPGPLDGLFGPQTQQALRRYQRTRGLPVTGKLDNKTRKALRIR